MDAPPLLILIVLFSAVAISVVLAIRLLNDLNDWSITRVRYAGDRTPVSEPLNPAHPIVGMGRAFQRRMTQWLPSLAGREGRIVLGLRQTLARAGYRGPVAIPFFLGAVLVSGIVGLSIGASGFIIGVVVSPGESKTAWIIVCTVLGFSLPFIWLSYQIRVRQREILDHSPDALDLIRICLEAGLGFDASIQRVGQEFTDVSPALFDELRVLSLELRAGAGRAQALQSLAQRTDVPGVKSWVTMILQAEKFGTGVAEAVRIHSEQLRLERKMRAEEAAAKLSTKLLFPLIFCIFPSLLLVLIGPAVITIQQQFVQPMEQRR